MSRDAFDLSARRSAPSPDDVPCHRCLQPHLPDALDGMLWCDDCRGHARRVAGRRGRLAGIIAGSALAVWISAAVGPSNRYLVFWAVAVLVAYRLVSRLVQELGYGAVRAQNRPGARAPASPPG